MGPGGWQYFPNAEHLREIFWSDFNALARPSESEMELIKLARNAGLLIRYGTLKDR